ncbi:MAG: SurA N-terminal domain-containing protein [Anaerolineales bacterium]|jgi:parvulin-like peptidyl-prolyl isomerase
MPENRPRTERTLTRKQRAHLRRDDIQRRWVTLAAGLVLLLVVAIIGLGLLNQYVIQEREPVATVGGQAITSRDFEMAVRYQRYQLIQQYQQLASFASYLSGGSQQNVFAQQMQLISSELSDSQTLGQTVLNSLVQDRIIRQEAARRGIAVSEAEINERIQTLFGYYPNGTPTPSGSTLTPEPATSTPTASPTPAASPTAELTPAPTPTATVPVPTPTPYTAQAYQQDLQSYLATLKGSTGMSEADFRYVIGSDLFHQKVQDVATTGIAKVQDQVHVRHIVLQDEASAAALRVRLVNGEAWDKLASQYSLDTSTKDSAGDLGWNPHALLDPALAGVAYSMKPGSISQPVQTSSGWELINVVSRQVQAVSDTQYQQLVQQAMQTWLTQRQSKPGLVVTFDRWMDRVPTSPALATPTG